MSLNCRICRENTQNSYAKELFGVEGVYMLHEIELLTGESLNYANGLPSCICIPCADDLNVASAFRRRCIQTQQQLRLEFDVVGATSKHLELLNILQGAEAQSDENVIELVPNNKDVESPNIEENVNDEQNEIQMRQYTREKRLNVVLNELKRFTCSYCLMKFKYRNNKIYHERRFHNVKYKQSLLTSLQNNHAKLFDNQSESSKSTEVEETTTQDINHGSDTQSDDELNLDEHDQEDPLRIQESLTKNVGKLGENQICKKDTTDKRNQIDKSQAVLDKLELSSSPNRKLRSKPSPSTGQHLKRANFDKQKENNLKCRVLRHRRQKDFECNTCKSLFYSKVELTNHQSVHTREQNFNERFGLESEIQKPLVMTHAGIKRYTCKYCGWKFKYSCTKTYHTRKYHTFQSQLKRRHCEKVFISGEQLKRHENVHSSVRNYHCALCNESFEHYLNLKQHERTKKHKTMKEIKECKLEANQISISQNDAGLTVHVTKKERENGLLPKLCEKLFENEKKLKYHLHTHTGAKEFECNICKKRFLTKFRLKAHKVVHSSSRNYKCELCGVSFKNYFGFNQHQRSKKHKSKEDQESKANGLSY